MKDVFESFKYNNKTYVFYIENEKIKYGYLDNNEIKNDLLQDEIELLNYVMSRTMISNDQSKHVKCGITEYNNKIFRIMYDKISGLKFFYEIKNSKNILPCDEDNIYLMKKYNENICYYQILNDYSLKQLSKSEESTLFSEDRRKNIIHLFLRTGLYGIMITATVSCSVLLNRVISIKNEPYDTSIQYNPNELFEYIEKNKKLNQEEKEVVKESLKILDSSKKYVNMKHIENNLSDLDIKYEYQGEKGKKINDAEYYVLAQYSIMDNIVTVYCSDNVKDVDEHILHHELLHAYTMPPKTSLGMGLYEATTEGMAAEDTGCSNIMNRAYRTESLELCSLCELIGSEPIEEFEHSGNINTIEEALMKIDNNEQKAINLISNIDTSCKESSKEDISLNVLQQNAYETYDLFNYFCMKKNGKDITECPELSIYLNNNVFNPNSNNELQPMKIKGYFDENYKENNKKTIFTDEDIKGIFTRTR